MEMYTLDRLPLGQLAVIVSIDDDNKSKHRMLDLGFSKNAEICPVRKSPAGDPTAYLIKGTVVALRCEDARSINISLLER